MKLHLSFSRVRLQLLLLLLTTCADSHGRPQQSPGVYIPVCLTYEYYGSNVVNETCRDDTYFCAITESDGEPAGCIVDQECSSSTAYDLDCANSRSGYCCCKMGAGDSGRLPCNDVLNQADDSVWKKACTLPELKNKDLCQKSPLTTTTPAPTPKPAKDFPQKCMEFCRKKAEEWDKVGTGPFDVNCNSNYYGSTPTPYKCAGNGYGNDRCPSACDGYCSEDATKLHCPFIPAPVTESPYGFKLATVDLIAALGLGLTLAIMVGALAYDCVAKRRKRRAWTVAPQQEAPGANAEEGMPEDGTGAPENPDLQQQDNAPPPPSEHPSQHQSTP